MDQDGDRRALIVGVVSGNLAGLLIALLIWNASDQYLQPLVGNYDGILRMMLTWGSLLTLPGLTSGIAHRRRLMWGLLPVTILALWYYGACFFGNHFLPDWHPIVLMGGDWLGSSSLVCLVDWLLQQRRARAAQAEAAHISAASVGPVWPPPPISPTDRDHP